VCSPCELLQDTTGAKAFKRVNDNEWLGKRGSWSNRYEDTFGARCGIRSWSRGCTGLWFDLLPD